LRHARDTVGRTLKLQSILGETEALNKFHFLSSEWFWNSNSMGSCPVRIEIQSRET
jgi:hypothetical protein